MPMDISCGSLSSQKQILLEEQAIDRLSDLPDSVLHHVLSFCKTKDSVRTSVLSRRWQYLWTYVANIDLEFRNSYLILDTKRHKYLWKIFKEFMDRLLIFHNASNIRELRLKISAYVDNIRLNSWICAIVKHKVQYLDLHIGVLGRPILPLCLFNHHSLVVLKLNMECTLYAPISLHFPYLKRMYLSWVRFMNDLSLECLFSNCPVLVELALVQCEWENIQNVTLSIFSLRNLTIENDTEYKYIYDHHDIFDSHVKVIATNLACLTFASGLDINFEVSGVSSFEAASIFLPYDEGVEYEIGNRTLRLFSQINNVEKLTLFPQTIQTLRDVEDSLARLPTFYNLNRLIVDWFLYFDCCDYLLAFLDKTPMLEYLHLVQGCDEKMSAEGSLWLPADFRDVIMQKRVPTCFNSSLKTFSIRNFKACLLEIVMIEYVLKNATRLESLFISCLKLHEEDESVSEAMEKLLKVPRGSENCNIVFSFY